jgi:hypothetical protein
MTRLALLSLLGLACRAAAMGDFEAEPQVEPERLRLAVWVQPLPTLGVLAHPGFPGWLWLSGGITLPVSESTAVTVEVAHIRGDKPGAAELRSWASLPTARPTSATGGGW